MKKIIGIISISFLLGCTNGQSMDLEGRVAMKGSSGHSYLSIYDEKTKKSYKIENKEIFHLIKCQNQTVKLEARLLKKSIGVGFPAIIEVIKVEKD